MATATLGRTSVLRGDVRLLWVGETTSALGSSVTSIALPLVALTVLHAGVIAVGVLSAAAWLPWLLIGLPAGAWVDRLPKRPVLIACDAVSLALFAGVPVAAWLGLLTMAQLLVVALGSGVAKVFFDTAYRTLLPAVVPAGELTEVNARLQGSESAAQVAGPGLGGVIAQAFGAADALLADAVSFLVSLVCLRRMRTPEIPVPSERRALRAEIAEGVRAVVQDRLLVVLIVFGGTANLVLTGYSAIAVAFLVRDVGLSAGHAGLLLAVGQIGGVAGACVAPAVSRRIGSARALLAFKIGATPFGLLIPMTGGGASLAFYCCGAFGLVGGIVAGNVVSSGFLPGYVPHHMFGRVTTAMQVVNFGMMPVGAVAGGVLAASLGFRPALWALLGTWTVSSMILLAAPALRGRELPTRVS